MIEQRVMDLMSPEIRDQFLDWYNNIPPECKETAREFPIGMPFQLESSGERCVLVGYGLDQDHEPVVILFLSKYADYEEAQENAVVLHAKCLREHLGGEA